MPPKKVAVDAKSVKEQFGRCPRGHSLPYRTNRGRCSPVHCAGSDPSTGPNSPKERRKRAEALPKAIVKAAEAEDVEATETEALQRHGGRLRAVHKHFGLPEKLEGADAEEWADKRLVALVPRAVVEVQRQLEAGDDEQRFRAAKQVLDSTGRGKREVGGAGATPIIMLVNPGGGPVQVPWAQRVDAASLVEGADAKKPT